MKLLKILASFTLLLVTMPLVNAEISSSGALSTTQSGTTVDTHPITVTAEPATGTYSGVVLVTLKANDPRAKIWYVLDPNAHPGEAIRYKKPIRLEKSSPVLFFAYINEQTESKIEREDYTVVPLVYEVPGTKSVATATKSPTHKPASTHATSTLARATPTRPVAMHTPATSTGNITPSVPTTSSASTAPVNIPSVTPPAPSSELASLGPTPAATITRPSPTTDPASALKTSALESSSGSSPVQDRVIIIAIIAVIIAAIARVFVRGRGAKQ